MDAPAIYGAQSKRRKLPPATRRQSGKMCAMLRMVRWTSRGSQPLDVGARQKRTRAVAFIVQKLGRRSLTGPRRSSAEIGTGLLRKGLWIAAIQ